MKNKNTSYIRNLESKIHILEHENEILSAKAEENLLLTKAFEEVGNYDDVEGIFSNILESISILLDIQFSGVFVYVDNHFECVNCYALFQNENSRTRFFLQESKSQWDPSQNIGFFYKNEAKLVFENAETSFYPECYLVIRLKTVLEKNRYFIFATDRNCPDLRLRGSLLEKVIQIISVRIERIFYHKELTNVNQELQLKNEELLIKNLELKEKGRIIHEQNAELITTMEQLKETQTHLIQSEKMASLGVLTAGVAHEMNNPLNYIMGGYVGLNEYLKEEDMAGDERVIIMLNSIKEGIKKATDIINGLNQFSRDNKDYNENCDIHSILDNCHVILNNQTKDRIEVIKRYFNEPLIVKGNVGKLHQAFINILTNAYQAIENKGQISLTTLKIHEKVVIIITDTGCGIKKEDLTRVIEPFFTTKDPGKGTGLGLSVVYKIIKEHKGTLEIESELNIGTSVRIHFSLNKEPDNRNYF